MKRIFIRVFFAAAVAAVLFSCSTENMETESYQFNENYYLTADTLDGVLTVNMQVELPEKYKDKAILEKVRNSIVEKLFGNGYVRFQNSEVLARFAAGLKQEYRINNRPYVSGETPNESDFDPEFYASNDYLLEAFSLLNDGKIYSYGVDLYVYMGGAHGITNRMYYNYDLRSGNLITEKELFVENARPALTELIKKNIGENNPDLS